MLIATFGDTTEWVGKSIRFEGGQFILEGNGPISAADVMEHDRQGHLVWESDGTRAWVGGKARTATASPAVAQPPDPPAGQPPAAATPAPTIHADGRTSGQRSASTFGLLLLILGLGAVIYFFAFFDTSVPVESVDLGNGQTIGGGRVNNIGLMADRQNGIIVGFGAAAFGGVLMAIGRRRPTATVSPSTVADVGVGGPAGQANCSVCAGPTQVGTTFCPRCGTRLTWSSAAAPTDPPAEVPEAFGGSRT